MNRSIPTMEVDKESNTTQSASAITSRESDQPSKDEDEQTRLWRTVKGNPSDFTSWTSLLQVAEQKVTVPRLVSNLFA